MICTIIYDCERRGTNGSMDSAFAARLTEGGFDTPPERSFYQKFFFRLSNPLLEERGGICATYYPLDDGAHPGFFFCLFLFTETK